MPGSKHQFASESWLGRTATGASFGIILSVCIGLALFFSVLAAGLNKWSVETFPVSSFDITWSFGVLGMKQDGWPPVVDALNGYFRYSCSPDNQSKQLTDDQKNYCVAWLAGGALTLVYMLVAIVSILVSLIYAVLSQRRGDQRVPMWSNTGMAFFSILAAMLTWACSIQLLRESALKVDNLTDSHTLKLGPSWGLLWAVLILLIALVIFTRARIEFMPSQAAMFLAGGGSTIITNQPYLAFNNNQPNQPFMQQQPYMQQQPQYMAQPAAYNPNATAPPMHYQPEGSAYPKV